MYDCIVLCCVVLYCIVLCCIVLYLFCHVMSCHVMLCMYVQNYITMVLGLYPNFLMFITMVIAIKVTSTAPPSIKKILVPRSHHGRIPLR